MFRRASIAVPCAGLALSLVACGSDHNNSTALNSMFDFSNGGKNPTLLLDQTQGAPVSPVPVI